VDTLSLHDIAILISLESLSMHATSEPLGDPERQLRTGGETYHEARNRGSTASSSRAPRPVPPKKYGCPGQEGSCPEHRRRAWRSLVTFFEHLQNNHLGEFETPDGLMCPECAKRDDSKSPIAYPLDGRELAKHIWTDH
jgi:hypothetical protein